MNSGATCMGSGLRAQCQDPKNNIIIILVNVSWHELFNVYNLSAVIDNDVLLTRLLRFSFFSVSPIRFRGHVNTLWVDFYTANQMGADGYNLSLNRSSTHYRRVFYDANTELKTNQINANRQFQLRILLMG